MIKLVVYDCDGVLVDSSNVIFTYYDWLMNKCELPPIDWSDDKFRLQIISLAETDILKILAKNDEKLFQKLHYVAKNEPCNIGFEGIKLEPNLVKGLDYIKSKNLSIAIVTNRGKSLPYLLDYFKISGYFDMYVTANDVKNPKPSPEGLYKVCSTFNVSPCEIVYIGDSPVDYEAAKVCEANFIAYKKPLKDAPIMFNHIEIKDFI